jgi:competence ComEA-like helix-hairpin-helix protein
MKKDKYPIQGKYIEVKYRELRKQWEKIGEFFRKDYPAILLGVLFTAAMAFSILSYKQNKGKESFSVSKSSILGEKSGSVSAVATTSARGVGSEEGPLVSSVSGTKTATKSNSVPSKSGFPININTADISTLIELPDIGESRAKDIIEYRQRFGPFKNIRELMNIKGIKEGRFEKIKGLVTVGD